MPQTTQPPIRRTFRRAADAAGQRDNLPGEMCVNRRQLSMMHRIPHQ